MKFFEVKHIKLENILVGNKNSGLLYLIDFGVSSTYLQPNGEHIKKKALNKFTGNILFGSRSSCRGNNKSRRDDIESAFYLLIYLMNNNKLPWSDFDNQKDFSFKDCLKQRLKKSMMEKLFTMIPCYLCDCLKCALSQSFKEKPPYIYLLYILNESFEKAVRA